MSYGNDVGVSLRNDVSFRTFVDRHHHLPKIPKMPARRRRTQPSPFTSPLTDIHFLDMVHDIAIDPFHCVYKGIFPRFLIFMVLFIQKSGFAAIGRLYEKLLFPREFTRKSRNFDHFKMFKATELRMLVLYGFEMLAQLSHFPGEALKLSRYLTMAVRIMSDPRLYETHRQFACNLCKMFIKKSILFFGDTFVTLAVHLFVHLPAETEKFGPLDKFSVWKFENVLAKLKKMTMSTKNPLVNITKKLRVCATLTSKSRRVVVGYNEVLFSKKHQDGRFTSITTENIYLSNEDKDAHFSAEDGNIYKACYFTKEYSGDAGLIVRVFAKRFETKTSPYYCEQTTENVPAEDESLDFDTFRHINASELGIFGLANLSSEIFGLYFNMIDRKYVVHDFDGSLVGYPLL